MPSETLTAGQDFTVPDGIFEATVTLEGEAGEDADALGGDGGRVVGTLTLTPGETLYIRRSLGGNGFSAGGGGDSIDIRQGGESLSDRVAVAAGGGGGGEGDSNAGAGGAGGGDTGESGSGGGGAVSGGLGGDQTSGGSGGRAQDGSFGDGGDGEERDRDGAGGGAGWYGGGGGDGDGASFQGYAGAGGGGGSNYVGGLDSVTANERGTGNSHNVEIEYTEQPLAPNNTEQSVDGDESIGVTWSEDTSGGASEDYDVQLSIDGGSFTQITNTSNTSYTYAATPSDNNHRFRVRANNSGGSSDWSYTEAVDTDPTNLVTTGTAQSEISLAWDGVRDATGYEVLRAESSGSDPADYTAVATPSASLYTDTDLEDGEQYYYRVRAIYSGTPSQPTGEVDATTPLPSPTIDTLDTTTAREISVEYTLPDDSTDGDLTIERSEDDGATWTTIATVTDLSATTYTDTGLLDGEEYTYRLTRDTGDASAESIDSAITDLPAPTVLAPDAAGDTHLGVSWDATHNNGDTRVEYREDDSGDWVTHTTVARDTEQATVDGLLNGQLYGIRVVAETDHAESEDQ